MNILYYDRLKLTSFAPSAVHIYEVLNGLSRLGHNVVALDLGSPGDIIEVDANRQLSAYARLKNSASGSRVLRPIMGEISTLWSFLREIYIFILALIVIARHKGRFDIIYRRHYQFNSERLLARLFKIHSVTEVNEIMLAEAKSYQWRDRLLLWIIDRIERFNMPKADKIIVVTSRLKEVLQNDYGVPGNKIVVILNGANTDLFKPMDTARVRGELGLNRNNNYICYLGAFFAVMGIEYLIRSAPLVLEEYPEARFLIVGDGIIKEELIELTKQIGVSDQVIFTGMIPYDKVPLYLNASDICVAPFIDEINRRYGLSPLKIYEYMACGKPVVATRVSGLEILEQCNAGLLVNSEDERQLAEAIVTLLKDKELRAVMGENGRIYVVENHSWASVTRRVVAVFEQAIKE